MQTRSPTLEVTESWDDYRFLEATARAGSFQAAARALGVATSTVSRRMAALEQRLGTRLVERQHDGVALTSAGRLLAAAANAMQAEMQRTEHRVANLDSGLSGRVRLTAGEGFGTALVAPLVEFRHRYPQIDVELTIDSRVFDLARGEADLAIRVPRPREPGLRVRKLASLHFGLFASAEYLQRRGVPKRLSDLDTHEFIGFSGDLVHMFPAMFMAQLAPKRFAARVNVSPLVRELVCCHLGIGVLATHTQDLVRVLPEHESEGMDVWLARHPSTRGVRRVDRLADFLAEYVSRAT